MMTTYLSRPSIAQQISNTKTRLYSVERRLQQPVPVVPGYVAKWSLGGEVTVSSSGVEQHPSGGFMFRIYATLRVPGNTVTTVDLRIDGTTAATLIIPIWSGYNDSAVSLQVTSRHQLTVHTTTAGDGAEDLAVFAEFR